MRLLPITTALFACMLALAASAQAQTCMGKHAKTIGKSGHVSVDRHENVMLTGKHVRVNAEGDNRICSTTGDIWLTFGKGSANLASLGSGNDKVIISHKASKNIINLGDGNNSIKFKNKAVKQQVTGGSGNDNILYAYKTTHAIINAGGGNNTVTLASKATTQNIKTGDGNDKILIKEPAKTNHRLIKTGLGDDNVNIIAKGPTTTYLSDKTNPKGLPDTDLFSGGPSNDTVYDYSGGTDADPNVLLGFNGFDKLHSEGNARSDIYGGDGTDWIYDNSDGDAGDRLFGERGNDKLFANQGDNSAKGAFMDGGEGDDWYYGTAGNDTMIALSGIKKIFGYGGNDTIIKTGNGKGTIEGGDGYDTVSYIAHTPPGFGGRSGVMANLATGVANNGSGVDSLQGIEHLIGSPFDDLLTGAPDTANQIDGGIGDDEITAQDNDTVFGGLGVNDCTGGKQVDCNRSSPGRPSGREAIVDIGQEGILSIIGSTLADNIHVSYDQLGGDYLVNTDHGALASRDCTTTQTPNQYRCPAPRDILSAVTIAAGAGNDNISIDNSVPSDVNTIIGGGPDDDTVIGGKTKDFVSDAEHVNGGDGSDILNGDAGSDLQGGSGSDTLHFHNPCIGGTASGGSGKDGIVFAGADHGVDVSLKGKYAKWNGMGCGSPLKLKADIESVEGSAHDDILTGRNHGKTGFLGREGTNTFFAKNGVKDTITTGPAAHKNIVHDDKVDKVIWGWGLAAF